MADKKTFYPADDVTPIIITGDKLEPFEVIAARLGVEKWHAAATAAYHRWAIGKEVTESAFKVAVEKMLSGSVIGPG